MRSVTCYCLALIFVPRLASQTQGVPSVLCSEVHNIAHISRVVSFAELAKVSRNSEGSYRAQILVAARSFELQPGSKSAAVKLLSLLPQNDAQHIMLITLGDSLCDEESVAEMNSLSRLGDILPRDFAKAGLLAPDKLTSYISYAPTSVGDPHSDYAVNMKTVCRARHPEFVKSVGDFPTEQRDWFVKHVFNPDGCHALALPDAD